LYKIQPDNGKQIALAPTHEEQVTVLAQDIIRSYKDLPVAVYQIQTKFRNEARAKSGLLRGREFIMKDMYSFHATEEDFNHFYEEAKKVYLQIFNRMDLGVKIVEASGGVFSEFSYEFQLLAPQGEDEIYYCDKCDFAQNKEIAQVKIGDKCPRCDGQIQVSNGIEIGNIFPLGKNFTEKIGCKFLDKDGKENFPLMGCYGIGLTRCLGSVVESKYDVAKNRMIWPKKIAPFDIHLISLTADERATQVYDNLSQKYEVLFDERDLSAGLKFAEADLIGCPKRIVISQRSLQAGGAEVLDLLKNSSKIVSLENLSEVLDE
jgi:prolyl-tRNA synthetase